MASTAAPSVSPELRSLLRRLKLGRSLDTLPERLALARQNTLSHAEFLELVLADEVERRDRTSAGLRAGRAPRPGHGPRRLGRHRRGRPGLWGELTTLRFVEVANNVLALGPSGSAKRSWPPRWATSRCADGPACTSTAPGLDARKRPRA